MQSVKIKENYFLFVILFFALFIRLIYIFTFEPSEITLDSKFYYSGALNILNHHCFSTNFPKPTAFTTPGYPVFLSVIYFLFGENNHLAVRIIQVIFNLFTILCIYLICLEVIKNKIFCNITVLLCAIYIPFITISERIIIEAISPLFLVLYIYLFILAEKHQKIIFYLLEGFILGINCLIKPVPFFLPLFIFVLDFFYYISQKNREELPKYLKQRIRRILILYSIALITLSPWIIRNYFLFKKIIPFSTESGAPFYWGVFYNYNYPKEKYFIEGLDEIQQNKFWWEEGKKHFVRELKNEPIKYTLWYLSKAKTMWDVFLTPENMNWKLLKINIIQHSFIISLMTLGFIFMGIRRNWIFLLFIYVLLYHIILHIPFIGLPRYMFPSLYFAIILGGYAVYEFINILRNIKIDKKKWLFILFFSIWVYFLFLLKNNYKQSSGIINLDFTPLVLSKLSGFFGNILIFISFALLVIIFYKFKLFSNRRSLIGFIVFILFFYLGQILNIGPMKVKSLDVGMGFMSDIDKDSIIEHIIDIPKWAENYKNKQMIIKAFNSDNNPIQYKLNIIINDEIVRSVNKGEYFNTGEISIPLKEELINNRKYLHVKVEVYVSDSINYPIFPGVANLYRGISKLNGQYENLALFPKHESGTYNIGLRLYGESKSRNVYFWRGSPRKKLLREWNNKE